MRRSHSISCRYRQGYGLLIAWIVCHVSVFADAGGVSRKNEAVLSTFDICLLVGIGNREDGFAGSEGNVSVTQKAVSED